MVTRDTNWPEGTPCWVDLGVDDVEKARVFYSCLLGWDIPLGSDEFGGYTSCTKDGRNVAGLAPKMSTDQPTAWTVYLATDDIEATLARAKEHGAHVVAEPMQVGPMGSMALFADPDGAFVGLWQGGTHTGFELANEPGSVTWNENMCRDYERNRAFYAAVFGYEYADIEMDGTDYATLSVNGEMVGGIGRIGADMPVDTPPHWTVCFKVEDTDAALARITELGGRTLVEPEDSEYGRIGSAIDDQGAPFWVMADLLS